MRVYRLFPGDSTTLGPLKSTQTLSSVLSARVCGLIDALAKTILHGGPPALQQLSLDGNPLLLLEEQDLVIMSSGATDVVDINRRLVGLLSRGEYSTDIASTATVDPAAAKAVESPTNGITIERSDVSLTTTSVGRPSKV